MKSTEIQAEINSKNALIDQEATKGQQTNHEQIIQWRSEITQLQTQLATALADEATHAGRIADATQQAKYLLDNITIAGVPVSECGMDEDTFNILRSKIELAFVGQADGFSKQLTDQQTASQAETKRLLADAATKAEQEISQARQETYQFKSELEAMTSNRDNAARMLDEANAQIEQLNSHITDLQAQIAVGVRGAIQVESTDEQIKQQEEALKASRIKVTSMVKNDPSGVSDRLWDIVLADTGVKQIINYLEKGKYTVITAEEAAQIAASKPAVLEVPDLTQVNAEPQTPSQEVPTAAVGLDGNGDPAQVVGESTQAVVTLESLKAEVEAIKAHIGMVA